jgi:hypothetical protein
LQVHAPGLGGGGMRAPSFKSKQPPALALDLIKARPRGSSLEDLAARDGETAANDVETAARDGETDLQQDGETNLPVQLSVTADQDSLVCVDGWVSVFLYVCTYMYMCICIFTHTHTHTHTHTQALSTAAPTPGDPSASICMPSEAHILKSLLY